MLVWKGVVCSFLESSQSSEEQLTPWSCRCGCRLGRAGVNEGWGWAPGVGGVERCLEGEGAGTA